MAFLDKLYFDILLQIIIAAIFETKTGNETKRKGERRV